MRKWLIIITCAIVILAVYIFGIKTGEKIAAKSTTQPKSALAIPNMSNTELGVWANEAAATIFSYNFSNYKEALQKSQIYFTPAGWKSYEAAFTKSPTLKMVLKDKLVVSAVALAPPQILQQSVTGGVYTWKVKLPMLVSYKGAKSSSTQKLTITMEIKRTKDYLGKRGAGIENFTSVVS